MQSGLSIRCLRLGILLTLASFLVACGGGSSTRLTAEPVAATANPLVAQYSVHPGAAGQVFVEFGTDTSYGRQTSSSNVNAGDILPILVAGMKPSTTYHMRAKVLAGANVAWTDQDQVFTTGALGS